MSGRFASDDPRVLRRRTRPDDGTAALANLTRAARQGEAIGQQGPAMTGAGAGLKAQVAALKRKRAAAQKKKAVELGLKTRYIA